VAARFGWAVTRGLVAGTSVLSSGADDPCGAAAFPAVALGGAERSGKGPSAFRRIMVFMLLLIGLLLVQLFPYGRQHPNPTVAAEPSWPSDGSRDLAVRACFDCHSNQTQWPWCADVAPVSWLIQFDVQRGRLALNFSEWDTPQRGLREMVGVLKEGEMPPAYYVLLHPSSRLNPSERDLFERTLLSLR
jgi:hypothetical protein